MEEVKQCSECEETKCITEFYKKRSDEPLSLNNSGYQCKVCELKYRRGRIGKGKTARDLLEVREKECSKCNVIKPLEEFVKDTWMSTGYRNHCYSCQRKRQRTPEFRSVVSATNKERRKIDPLFSLARDMRSMVARVFGKIGTEKEDRTFDLLGYSPLDLKLHLEKQFVSGMSWLNKGIWHKDHIISIYWFLERGITDVSLINCLENLRPMWGPDNIKKGGRIPDNIKIDYNGDNLNPQISFTEDLGTCVRRVVLQGKKVLAWGV